MYSKITNICALLLVLLVFTSGSEAHIVNQGLQRQHNKLKSKVTEETNASWSKMLSEVFSSLSDTENKNVFNTNDQDKSSQEVDEEVMLNVITQQNSHLDPAAENVKVNGYLQRMNDLALQLEGLIEEKTHLDTPNALGTFEYKFGKTHMFVEQSRNPNNGKLVIKLNKALFSYLPDSVNDPISTDMFNRLEKVIKTQAGDPTFKDMKPFEKLSMVYKLTVKAIFNKHDEEKQLDGSNGDSFDAKKCVICIVFSVFGSTLGGNIGVAEMIHLACNAWGMDFNECFTYYLDGLLFVVVLLPFMGAGIFKFCSTWCVHHAATMGAFAFLGKAASSFLA